jgi:hypothetical protein
MTDGYTKDPLQDLRQMNPEVMQRPERFYAVTPRTERRVCTVPDSKIVIVFGDPKIKQVLDTPEIFSNAIGGLFSPEPQ